MPVQYSYNSTPPMCRTACTQPQCLYSRAITLLPAVPVQYSYTSNPLNACTVQLNLYSPQCLYSTAIPLLPSVPVQYSYTSIPLSACTVQLYLYSPCGSHGLYRATVPVQYSYTSTPPVGRTARTHPECLYRVYFIFAFM